MALSSKTVALVLYNIMLPLYNSVCWAGADVWVRGMHAVETIRCNWEKYVPELVGNFAHALLWTNRPSYHCILQTFSIHLSLCVSSTTDPAPLEQIRNCFVWSFGGVPVPLKVAAAVWKTRHFVIDMRSADSACACACAPRSKNHPVVVMDQATGLGLSINNFYAAWRLHFMHADDIRTLATSAESLEAQMAVHVVKENFLKLSAGKCEIVMFARDQKTAAPVCKVDGVVVPAGDVGKCLGYWWKEDLLATQSVAENVRGTFFHYGNIGAFQGDLSPLSSGSVLEMCVMPILLNGCENWMMTHALVEWWSPSRASW